MRTIDVDLAVVGGGIQGLYTAFHALEKWPKRSVAVFDKSGVGSGASRVAPGIQLAFGCNSVERQLSRTGQRAWDEVFSAWNWRPGREIRINWITQDPERVRVSATQKLTECTTSISVGLPGRSDELRTQQVFEGTCSYDPVAPIVKKLKSEIISRGGMIHENTYITNIESESDLGLKLIDARGKRFPCLQVIVALGPWIVQSPLATFCSSISDVKIKKVVALSLNVAPSRHDPALALADDYAFLLPILEEKRWLFSFSSDDWGVSPDSSLSLMPWDTDKAQTILERYVVLPFKFDLPATRIFCDAYTVDGLPRVETADFDSRISFIFGGGGNGFRFAPPLAKKALERVDGLVKSTVLPKNSKLRAASGNTKPSSPWV